MVISHARNRVLVFRGMVVPSWEQEKRAFPWKCAYFLGLERVRDREVPYPYLVVLVCGEKRVAISQYGSYLAGTCLEVPFVHAIGLLPHADSGAVGAREHQALGSCNGVDVTFVAVERGYAVVEQGRGRVWDSGKGPR